MSFVKGETYNVRCPNQETNNVSRLTAFAMADSFSILLMHT